MYKLFCTITFLSMLFLSSCGNIFEDRESCPTTVLIDYSQCGEEINSVKLWLIDSNGNTYSSDVKSEEFGHLDQFAISKGEIHCYAWGNISSASRCSLLSKGLERYAIQTRENNAPDSLYFFEESVVAQQDTTRILIKPYRQFTTVHIDFIGYQYYSSISALLLSSSNGFYNDGKNIFEPSRSYAIAKEGKCSVRLLRQPSLNGMELTILYSDRESNTHSSIFDLTSYLQKIGYDMSEKDLKDIFITVDLSRLSGFITIGEWRDNIDFIVKF